MMFGPDLHWHAWIPGGKEGTIGAVSLPGARVTALHDTVVAAPRLRRLRLQNRLSRHRAAHDGSFHSRAAPSLAVIKVTGDPTRFEHATPTHHVVLRRGATRWTFFLLN